MTLSRELREQLSLLPLEDQKQMKKEIRVERLRDDICSICIDPLGVEQSKIETSKFFKTPCGHRFHKACLVDWMGQKHQCPVCRKVIP